MADGGDSETIHVFESAEKHAFGVVFVKGKSESEARETLKDRPMHSPFEFDHLGVVEEWLDEFRESDEKTRNSVYYR